MSTLRTFVLALALAAGLAGAIVFESVPAGGGTQRTLGDSDSWMTSWQNDDKKNFAYGLVDPATRSTFMYGQQKDFEAVDKLRKQDESAVIWARVGSKRYLIEDEATLREAQSIAEPLLLLSREQGRLGSLQGELGSEQGKLGAEQGKLGREQGQLGVKQATAGIRQSAAALDEDEEAQEALEKKQRDLGAEQQELGRRQASLGKHQASMGEMQADLGRRQAELGERQKQIQPGINARIQELVKRSIEDGRARRI